MSDMDLFEFEFTSMTTPCQVQLYAANKQTAAACYKQIKNNTLRLEKKYSFYDRASYLSREINSRRKNAVLLDLETFKVLTQVRVLSERTNDFFDITVGTLKSCYKLDSIAEVEACLAKKRSYTGLNAWALKDKKLHLKNKQTLLDLGGVIKEYAVDEAAKIAKKCKIQAALIDYGGDIFGYGLKSDGEPFAIAITHPQDPSENIVVLPLNNQAITTSASYARNREIEGTSFSHIIGKKVDSAGIIISSTVISDSVLTSGIYSTVFMLDMGIYIPEEMGVVLVDNEMNIHQNLMD